MLSYSNLGLEYTHNATQLMDKTLKLVLSQSYLIIRLAIKTGTVEKLEFRNHSISSSELGVTEAVVEGFRVLSWGFRKP